MRFPPWIGSDFGNSNDGGIPPRLLLVGESHYGDLNTPDKFTKLVVEKHSTEEWNIRFFTDIQNSILGGSGSISGEDRKSFFKAVAFYNFVQDMVPDQNTRPTDKMFERGTKLFPSCLDSVKPTHIVVFGFGVWDCLPNEKFLSCSQLEQDILKHLPSEYKNNERHRQRGWIGQYEYSGGSTLIMKCLHPSYRRRRFSAKKWHPVIRWFLQLN